MDDQNDADIEAELAAVNAEIHRLTQRRNELLARRGSVGIDSSQSTPAASTTPTEQWTPVEQPAVSSQATKPDWYPDPFGRYTWRYRDERGWTSWVARGGVTAQDPPGLVTPSTPSSQWAPPSAGSQEQATELIHPIPTASFQPTREEARETPDSEVLLPPARTESPAPAMPRESTPTRVKSDVDIGKLMLIIGAALVIGGIAGLTAWLWTRLPGIGRLALLGLASALQIVFATRIRERLQAAAEAFAATGAATLLFATASVAATATWDGTIGVVVGAVGIMLLLTARFRAWVIAGNIAIAFGAVALLVAEPWSHTAFIVAVVIGAVRVAGTKASAPSRSTNLDQYPFVLTAIGLMAWLAVPALAVGQFEPYQAALYFLVVAAGISEIAVRSRGIRPDHDFVLVSGAIAAVGGVAWSASLWANGGRSDGLVGMAVTAVVALLLWRAGRTEAEFERWLMPVSVVLLPVAARFACAPASARELVIFCAVAAVAGLVAIRSVGPGTSRPISAPTLSWFWVGAVGASIAATEQLAGWPRLGLATVALASVASVRKLDDLRYAAAVTATLTVADVLYGDASSVTWWFRPDLVGLSAAAALFAVNKMQSAPRSASIGTWQLPRHWESVMALLGVPVIGVASSPALGDLSDESLLRLGLVLGFTALAWMIGAVRRTRPNAAQLVSLLGVGVIAVSRIADESATVRSGAWVLIGTAATIVLMVLASVRKVDELRYVAAATATSTVAVLLFGDLFQLTWWFRPDLLGVAAALFLLGANRTHAEPPTLSINSWPVPRYWESVVALLAVPVVDVAMRPALMDLPHESLLRVWFVAGFCAVVWAIGLVRRTRPNSAQLVSALGVGVIAVSRVGDDSAAVRSGAWVVIGCLATITLAVLARVKKMDELRFAAAGTATLTAAVVLYGDLFELTWWFRPDLIGVVAAVALSVANRTCVTPRTVSIGTWRAPRYWESAVALVAVPTVDLVSQPAFFDLPTESVWRLGLLVALTVVVWTSGAVRRARPNPIQLATLVAVAAVIVSRIGDESLALQMTAWIGLGSAFIVGALIVRRVELIVAGVGCWAVAVIVYGPPGPLETTTLSFAAIMAIGATLARRFGRRGSYDFIPATALMLLPSAFAAAGAVLDSAVDSEQVIRISVVLVIGAVALAIGASRRLAALVGPSVVALVVLAGAQLIVVQRHASGWVSALIAGIVLLTVGTRLEYLRAQSRRAADLVRSLR